MLKILSKLSYSKSTFIGFGTIIFISLAYILFDLVNGKSAVIDFNVYYHAAQNLLAGKNLYLDWVQDHHYVFKYSPSSAIFFIPFTIFPYVVAKYVYLAFLTGMIILGFSLCMKLVKPDIFKNPKQANNIILLAIIPLVAHFTREIHLGQVNHLMLVIYISALWFFQKQNKVLAALLIAISVFIKPFGFIFIAYFIYKKEYKTVLTSFLFISIIALLPLLFMQSWYMFKEQYWMWYCELMFEMSFKQELLSPENHTLFSVFARYTPVRWFLQDGIVSLLYQLSVLGFIGAGMAYFIKQGKALKNINPMITEYGIIMAIIPLLAFTSSNAFGFSQLIVFITLINFTHFNVRGKILAVLSFFFIGGAVSDIIGKRASGLMDDLSLVSIGTIILIFLLYSLRKKEIA